jgi:hypothetical protein
MRESPCHLRNMSVRLRRLGTLVNSSDAGWEHWEDLPPEVENELIEKIARYVNKHKLGLMAEMSFATFGPFTGMFAKLGMGLFSPFLEFLDIDTYAALFRRKENLQRLMDRIDELKDES